VAEVVIRAEGLGKRYRLGARRERYRTLRETLTGLPRALGRRAPGDGAELLWALREVSFAVREGEVVGVIGRNGAGKSTLLKLLARITEPSAGRAAIHGRVGSLLEVGTGFHPELTGRENIYLNGSILGMGRAEIDRKFDAIVAFAEVERFLDTPVKRYSSGMHVRLAFAVAAHLEPEILLVDEVLAVGDAAFQKKCLGQMEDAARGGRTVLVVSHQLPVIRALCGRALLLDGGRIVDDGEPAEVIEAYLRAGEAARSGGPRVDLSGQPRPRSEQAAIREAWVENERGEPVTEVFMGRPFTLCFRFAADRALSGPGFGFGVDTHAGQRLWSLSNYLLSADEHPPVRAGVARCAVPECRLLPGGYQATLSLVERQSHFVDLVERALPFAVLPDDVFASGRIPVASQGLVYERGRVFVEPAGEE